MIYPYMILNDGTEIVHTPIHVHITKGQPNASSTKIWLTKNGGCIVANL